MDVAAIQYSFTSKHQIYCYKDFKRLYAWGDTVSIATEQAADIRAVTGACC